MDFDMKHTYEMIRAGQAPPVPWVLFIADPDLSCSSLPDVIPLAALNALRILDLTGTQVYDVTPSRGIRELKIEGMPFSNTPFPQRPLPPARYPGVNRHDTPHG